ncbi:MAG: alpha/beta hydrolase family protein [Gammaproteobacteria bacterium]
MKALLPLALLAAAAATPAAAEVVPVRDFARDAEWDEVKLSPNGDYVATTKRVGQHWTLGFFRISDSKVTGALNFGTFNHILDFWWVGPARVVVAIGHSDSYFDQPHGTGELYGVDVDGGGKGYLFGARGNASTGRWADAEMVDPMPRDPDWALIKIVEWGDKVPTHQLFRLNVHTGAQIRQPRAPADFVDYYLTDSQGRPRYAVATGDKFKTRSFVHHLDTDSWSELTQGTLEKATVHPVSFSEQESAVYFDSDELDLDRACLIREDLVTGKRTAVMCDATQSLSWVLRSADRSRPIAAVFTAGKPEMRVLAPDSAEGKVLTTLQNTFPGNSLGGFSWSLDGTKVVFLAYSDKDPGTYYLLDSAKGKIRRLLSRHSWIKPEQMGERRPMKFRARDGRTIHGYLTLPPGREPKNLPLVVNPHGGPFGIRDRWAWDAEPQLLASRGYAVVQVNFRGSGGYGNALHDAGKKNWVGMIDDITDGLRHVAKEGFVDPQRVCIYGVSFGGYASMMSAVREPDSYKCAIPFAGPYDLASLKRRSDIKNIRDGKYYMSEFIGDTPEIEREQSPLTHIDKLKAAVFIVHGVWDRRVPFEQARKLRAALDERKHPFEWLAMRDEGHGFANENNRAELYEKMLAFLEKHIGPGAPPAAAK